MKTGVIKQIDCEGYRGYSVYIELLTKEELEELQEMFGW